MNVISVYSREDALSDRVLIDVTGTASEAGFKIPVAITNGVQGLINNIPSQYDYQNYEGRLWDILSMAYLNACKNKGVREFNYSVIIHHNKATQEQETLKTYAKLICMVHGGDQGEPVITIMLPGED